MARLLIGLAIVGLIFTVYAFIDCASARRVRGVPKLVWLVVIVVVPILGGVLWLVIGRPPTKSAPRRVAPDDDPAFLAQLGGRARTVRDAPAPDPSLDDRLRRIEQELAEIDTDDDGDQPRPRG